MRLVPSPPGPLCLFSPQSTSYPLRRSPAVYLKTLDDPSASQYQDYSTQAPSQYPAHVNGSAWLSLRCNHGLPDIFTSFRPLPARYGPCPDPLRAHNVPTAVDPAVQRSHCPQSRPFRNSPIVRQRARPHVTPIPDALIIVIPRNYCRLRSLQTSRVVFYSNSAYIRPFPSETQPPPTKKQIFLISRIHIVQL